MRRSAFRTKDGCLPPRGHCARQRCPLTRRRNRVRSERRQRSAGECALRGSRMVGRAGRRLLPACRRQTLHRRHTRSGRLQSIARYAPPARGEGFRLMTHRLVSLFAAWPLSSNGLAKSAARAWPTFLGMIAAPASSPQENHVGYQKYASAGIPTTFAWTLAGRPVDLMGAPCQPGTMQLAPARQCVEIPRISSSMFVMNTVAVYASRQALLGLGARRNRFGATEKTVDLCGQALSLWGDRIQTD